MFIVLKHVAAFCTLKDKKKIILNHQKLEYLLIALPCYLPNDNTVYNKTGDGLY